MTMYDMSREMIKRLRSGEHWPKTAADRIEELVEENKELTLQLLAAHGQAADALDRAVIKAAVELMGEEHGWVRRERLDEAVNIAALRKLAKAVEIGNKMAKSIKGNYYIPNVVAEWNAVLAELEKTK